MLFKLLTWQNKMLVRQCQFLKFYLFDCFVFNSYVKSEHMVNDCFKIKTSSLIFMSLEWNNPAQSKHSMNVG